MFYKRLIATGFHSHHFNTFLKCFLSNILKIFYQNIFIPIFSECSFIKHMPSKMSKIVVSNKREFQRALSKMPHMQSIKAKIQWGTTSKPLSYNFRHYCSIHKKVGKHYKWVSYNISHWPNVYFQIWAKPKYVYWVAIFLAKMLKIRALFKFSQFHKIMSGYISKELNSKSQEI